MLRPTNCSIVFSPAAPFSTTRARTCPVLRSRMPATVTLLGQPASLIFFRRFPCMLFALPPTSVSSASTGPAKGRSSGSRHVSRSRCARCQADFWLMLRSRCSRMLETPFSEVVIMYMAITQTW